MHPSPLTHEQLLDLFKGKESENSFALEPATLADMCGVNYVEKPSLEVVYDEV